MCYLAQPTLGQARHSLVPQAKRTTRVSVLVTGVLPIYDTGQHELKLQVRSSLLLTLSAGRGGASLGVTDLR